MYQMSAAMLATRSLLPVFPAQLPLQHTLACQAAQRATRPRRAWLPPRSPPTRLGVGSATQPGRKPQGGKHSLPNAVYRNKARGTQAPCSALCPHLGTDAGPRRPFGKYSGRPSGNQTRGAVPFSQHRNTNTTHFLSPRGTCRTRMSLNDHANKREAEHAPSGPRTAAGTERHPPSQRPPGPESHARRRRLQGAKRLLNLQTRANAPGPQRPLPQTEARRACPGPSLRRTGVPVRARSLSRCSPHPGNGGRLETSENTAFPSWPSYQHNTQLLPSGSLVPVNGRETAESATTGVAAAEKAREVEPCAGASRTCACTPPPKPTPPPPPRAGAEDTPWGMCAMVSTLLMRGEGGEEETCPLSRER